ncbi:MAG: hypothetical protein AAF902_16885 [Chloroflexota bacterium]
MSEGNRSTDWRVELRKALEKYFDDVDLQTLCFDLRLDYDNVKRENKLATVIEIFETCMRRDIIEDLILWCQENRPNVPWDAIAKQAKEEIENQSYEEVSYKKEDNVLSEESSTIKRNRRFEELLKWFSPYLAAGLLIAIVIFFLWGFIDLPNSQTPTVESIITTLDDQTVPTAEDTIECLPPGPRWGTTYYTAYSSKLGCPISEEKRPLGAFQTFERGMMIWRQDLNQIYLLSRDGSLKILSGDEVPRGFFLSSKLKGGFGYYWSTYEEMRDILGEPLEIESHATDFAIQDFKKGTILFFSEDGAYNYILFSEEENWFKDH